MACNQSFDFNRNVSRALNDTRLRENLRSAMGSFIIKRKAVFPDHAETENLRSLCSAIKQRALSRLPELLEQLEKKCLSNGIQVHWAETTDQANRIVLDIMREHNADRMVKGKSMVSEEMHLNMFLKNNGIEALETDLGEFIIQLAGETPSHIIVPAIHKSKKQIAEILHINVPDTPYTEKVEELNAIARGFLRRKFFDAQVGLSGVNFAVAETGTLCLVENEGNGRMCTTVPPVHIALMGLEKVIERLSDLPPLLRLLTGSATGQIITTYVNMITSPRRAGEKDGPEEVHLIILDNGRSKIYSDPQFWETLKCIRCGTCLNHCPVYTRIGGHAYGFVYPGPIGKILNPQVEGIKKAGVLATASSLCLACEEVCPVKIPISDILLRLRNNYAAAGHQVLLLERLSWKAWKILFSYQWILSTGGKFLALFRFYLPRIGPLKHWTNCRTTPVPAVKRLRDLVKKEGIADE